MTSIRPLRSWTKKKIKMPKATPMIFLRPRFLEVTESVRHCAKNVRHGAKNVRLGAKNVQHGAEKCAAWC